MIDKNDISSYNETKKGMLLFDSNKKFLKKNTQELPNVFSSTLKNKNINKKSLNLNLEDIFESCKLKKALHLSKNKDTTRKSFFSPENGKTTNKFDINLDDVKTTKRVDREKSYLRKFTKKKIINKNEFLLFTKARPYRYMTFEEK